MGFQIKMTYANPERLTRVPDGDGGTIVARAPGSPTRPARAIELNCWWEELPPLADPASLVDAGAIVRLAPSLPLL
jgi:hypothetical protein